eukprot:CAMPEP_0119265726 /NCGR_PEP_ID=MMETSP1329-20130426/4446_1 /TAXON_ID=114041 /ORGANISM="Genus nov. species nov., Strain RCC1024" /LENGTH=152 /DNA_ID=CAMNT_0007265573 /DNA_START=447 /DNA_END=900 /DNA_ORIENTATION=-
MASAGGGASVGAPVARGAGLGGGETAAGGLGASAADLVLVELSVEPLDHLLVVLEQVCRLGKLSARLREVGLATRASLLRACEGGLGELRSVLCVVPFARRVVDAALLLVDDVGLEAQLGVRGAALAREALDNGVAALDLRGGRCELVLTGR